MLEEALGRHPRMNDDETASLQLVLTLLRNLLAIPDSVVGVMETIGRNRPAGWNSRSAYVYPQ
jgi:hypothetical protein